MDSEVIVACRNLEKRLGSRRILINLNLAVHRGSAVAVTGANGAGKSTLLRVIVGAWGRSDGILERFGQIVAMPGAPDLRIAYLGHQSLLYPSLTLHENLMLYGELAQLADLRYRLNAAVSRLQLTWYAHDVVGSYSRGTLQRAAIARLLMSDAAVWVMDEPFAGLDTAGRQILKEILGEAKSQGKTLLLTSHQPGEAEPVVDVVAVLEGGRFTRWWHVHEPKTSISMDKVTV
jgi:heme exporter protein A